MWKREALEILSRSDFLILPEFSFPVSQATRSFVLSFANEPFQKKLVQNVKKSVSSHFSDVKLYTYTYNQNAFQRLIKSFDWFSTNSNRNEPSDKIFYFSTYDIFGQLLK